MKKHLWLIGIVMLLITSAYAADLTRTLVTQPVRTPTGSDYVMTVYSSATGKMTRLATASNVAGLPHTQAINTVTGLQTALDAKLPAANPTATGTMTAAGFASTEPDGTRGVECFNTGDFSTTQPRALTTADAGVFCFNQTLGKFRYWNGTAIADMGGSGGASSIGQLSDWPAAVSATEVGYLDGVTSAIQGQFSALTTQVAALSTQVADLITAMGLAGVDATPEPFSFADQSDVALSTEMTSAPITVTGITSPTPIHVSGGSYDINGSGTFTSASGTVNNNDTVRARHTSSASYSTATNTVVTVGGVAGSFTSTTLAAPDTTPAAFGFTPQTDVALNTVVTSNAVPISGINAPAAISVTGGSYAIDGGSFTASPGTITNGQTVTAQHTSAASNSTTTTTTVTIGGVAGTFTSTTVAAAPVMYASQSLASGALQINNATTRWFCGAIVDSPTTHTVRKARFYIKTTGDISGRSYKARIYSLNGTTLNTILAESTNTVTGITAAGWVEFTFPPTALSQGNAFGVYSTDAVDAVVFGSVGYTTTDNDTRLGVETTGYSHYAYWNISGALTSQDTTRDIAYELFE